MGIALGVVSGLAVGGAQAVVHFIVLGVCAVDPAKLATAITQLRALGQGEKTSLSTIVYH